MAVSNRTGPKIQIQKTDWIAALKPGITTQKLKTRSQTFNYTLTGYRGMCPYVRSFLCVPTASLFYRLHFLTNCDETSHTCSQTASLVWVRTWASQVTCNPSNRGLLPWNGVTAPQTSFLNWLSWNFTHVFTNIISCTSLKMGVTGHM